MTRDAFHPDSTHDAYQRAVSPHVGSLRGVAMRLTRSPAEADDLVQETLARAWTFWHRFEPGTNARAWMHRILMNTFITRYRKRKREREVMERVARETAALRDTDDRSPKPLPPDAEDELAGLGDEVRAALGSIKPEFRLAVQLVDVQERSYREAAAALGCPVGTIMSRLHRGRRALREQLATYAVAEGYVSPAAAMA